MSDNKIDDAAVKLAILILRARLMQADEIYFGFLSSIESALMECGHCTNVHDLAICIMDRVMGYEML